MIEMFHDFVSLSILSQSCLGAMQMWVESGEEADGGSSGVHFRFSKTHILKKVHDLVVYSFIIILK